MLVQNSYFHHSDEWIESHPQQTRGLIPSRVRPNTQKQSLFSCDVRQAAKGQCEKLTGQVYFYAIEKTLNGTPSLWSGRQAASNS